MKIQACLFCSDVRLNGDTVDIVGLIDGIRWPHEKTEATFKLVLVVEFDSTETDAFHHFSASFLDPTGVKIHGLTGDIALLPDGVLGFTKGLSSEMLSLPYSGDGRYTVEINANGGVVHLQRFSGSLLAVPA